MKVETYCAPAFLDKCDLWKGAVLQVSKILVGRHQVRRVLAGEGLEPREEGVRHAGMTGIGCVINLPGDAGPIKQLKDVLYYVRIEGAGVVRVSVSSRRVQIRAIRRTIAGNWREPAVRGREVLRHIVVVIQIVAVVITHGAGAQQVVVPTDHRILGAGDAPCKGDRLPFGNGSRIRRENDA